MEIKSWVGSPRMEGLLGEEVLAVRIDVEDQPFHFLPGQFIGIGHESLKNQWQYYSIASRPGQHQGFDLCVSRQGWQRLETTFDQAKPKVQIVGPAGSLLLPSVIDHKLVFIATGTGVAPFRSMIHYLHQEQIPHQGIHLIFGAKDEKAILYRDEFEQLVTEMPGFEYDIVLSRQPQWNGHKGRVRDVYMSIYNQPETSILFYFCGWNEMIKTAIADLTETIGFSKDQLIYEIYE
jgi:NAD(P)H-flavin reductase